MDNEIFLEKIIGSPKQISILYELLKKRSHNISHQKMPSINEHRNFIIKNNYRVWYLVIYKEVAIGTFYIKYDNSIGIKISLQNHNIIKYILDFISSNFKPQDSIPSEIPPYFYFNLSCDNKELKDCFQSLNLKPFQISYKF